jgi:uncharacterized protein (DUF342 family)
MGADRNKGEGRSRNDKSSGRSGRRRRASGSLDSDFVEALREVAGDTEKIGGEAPAGNPSATAPQSMAPGGKDQLRFGQEGVAWLVVQVAKDGTEANLLELSLAGDISVDLQTVSDALADLFGIKAGINEDLLKQLVARAVRAPASVVRGKFPIARATEPQGAEEDRVEFLFLGEHGDIGDLTFAPLAAAFDADELPRVLEGNLMTQLVAPGQTLARVSSDTEKPVALDIFGKPLSGQPAERPLNAGSGVKTEGELFLAEIHGYVYLQEKILSALSPIWVSPDHMEAYFVRFPQRQTPPLPQSDWILRLLESKNVLRSIDEPAVEKLCQHELALSERTAVRLASAKDPVNGADARVEYTFDPDKKAGLILEDGSIDLRERNVVVSVRAEELIGEFFTRTTGEPGFNLSGKHLSATDGKERTFTAGENVRVEAEGDDGQKFFAEIDGHVEIDGDTLHVRTVFDVRGDLDYEVGNIDVPGDVQISGSIKPGFSVKAGGSVTTGGAVAPGASVHARSDVVVSQGILGDTTTVVALGNVETKFIQNSSVMAKEDITVGSYIFNARVRAGGQVVVKSGGGERGEYRRRRSHRLYRDSVTAAGITRYRPHRCRHRGEPGRLGQTVTTRSRTITHLRRNSSTAANTRLRELEATKEETLEARRSLQTHVEEGLSRARIAASESVYTDVHFRFGETTQTVTKDLGPTAFVWSDGGVRYRPL